MEKLIFNLNSKDSIFNLIKGNLKLLYYSAVGLSGFIITIYYFSIHYLPLLDIPSVLIIIYVIIFTSLILFFTTVMTVVLPLFCFGMLNKKSIVDNKIKAFSESKENNTENTVSEYRKKIKNLIFLQSLRYAYGLYLLYFIFIVTYYYLIPKNISFNRELIPLLVFIFFLLFSLLPRYLEIKKYKYYKKDIICVFRFKWHLIPVLPGRSIRF